MIEKGTEATVTGRKTSKQYGKTHPQKAAKSLRTETATTANGKTGEKVTAFVAVTAFRKIPGKIQGCANERCAFEFQKSS